MIVLVIVAVVGAIALPRYSQASARQQLSSAANRVTADIELARTRSRAASQPVRLTFSTENNTYSFDNIGGEAIRVDLSASPYNVSIEVAKFGADSNVALFNGYGVPANSGVVTLSNHTGTVSVNMLGNGEVRR
jgi:type II secretory pathway pseudopilin PulG